MPRVARLRKVGGSVMLATPKVLLNALDLAPDAPVGLDRKADGSIRGKIERVEQDLGDREHDRSPDFPQAGDARHDTAFLELHRDIPGTHPANKIVSRPIAILIAGPTASGKSAL